MEALMATSAKMSLVQVDEIHPIEVGDGTNCVNALPTKPFRKYVQRVWNTFDVIKGWTGELPDFGVLADLMQRNSYDTMPVPFAPKNAAPVRNMHILITESADAPGAVDIVKFVSFREPVGYKILGAVCHGEALQFEAPDGGSRSKAARVALHRYMMGINGTHFTCYATKDVGEDQAEAEGTKRKILSVEEIDAGFDLIREDNHRISTASLL